MTSSKRLDEQMRKKISTIALGALRLFLFDLLHVHSFSPPCFCFLYSTLALRSLCENLSIQHNMSTSKPVPEATSPTTSSNPPPVATAEKTAKADGSNGGPSRARRAMLLDNLMFPVNKEGGRNSMDTALAARRTRPAFTHSPFERETNRTNRNGTRQLSELEILQEKHEPEFRQIIPAIADALSAVLAQHTVLAQNQPKDDRFSIYETTALPSILIEDYVHRIAEYTYISPSSMVAALILLDRLSTRFPTLLYTQLNIYKLFFVAVRVASKVVDLRTLNNKNFASVGGVSNRHLNDLEARFVIDLHFDVLITPGEFTQFAARMQPHSNSVPRPPNRRSTGGSSTGTSQQVVRTN